MSFDDAPPPPPPPSPPDPLAVATAPAGRVSMPLPPGVPPPPGHVPPPYVPPPAVGAAPGRNVVLPAQIITAVGALAVAGQFWHRTHDEADVSTTYSVLVVLLLVAGAVLSLLGRRFGLGLALGSVAATAGINEFLWAMSAARRLEDLHILDVLGFLGSVLVGVGVAVDAHGRRRAWNWPFAAGALAVAAVLAGAPYWAYSARDVIVSPPALALMVTIAFFGSAAGRGVAVGAVVPTIAAMVAVGGDDRLPLMMFGVWRPEWSTWQVVVILLCSGLVTLAFAGSSGEPDAVASTGAGG